ncbi:MAG: ImmA/IrrE family metallo-endopeptidase [Frankiaceae bacterium]|nr:ImmA/IrrE family metallo-endopeptidase [Frankiaceae bacterium]
MAAEHLQLADRLRQAIEASGLTQHALAEAAELDPTALSKVLSGKRQISSLELARVAKVIDASVAWLLLGDEALPEYRLAAKARETVDNEGVRRALERVQDFLETEDLLRDLGWTATPKRLPIEDLQPGAPIQQANELAAKVRDLVGEGDEDIEELAQYCEEKLGIDVAIEPLPPGVDGLSIACGNYQLALISSAIPATRQRYTLAHEIGHLAAGDSNELTIDETLTGQSDVEARATAFAAAFLMPESSLRRSLGSVGPTEATIVDMLVRYKVSLDTLATRLYYLELVDATSRERIRGMSARRLALLSGRRHEYFRQLQDHEFRRLPVGLLGRALDAFQQGAIGAAVLSRLTRIPVEAILNQFGPLPAWDDASEGRRELVF